MFRRLAIAILLAAVAAAAAAPSVEARSRAFVAKPSKITCIASNLGQKGASVRCDLPFIGHKAVFLHTLGKARIKHVSGFVHPRRRPTLTRGAELKLGQFTCKSLKTAVTCRSSNGHGFTVGRKFQLTF